MKRFSTILTVVFGLALVGGCASSPGYDPELAKEATQSISQHTADQGLASGPPQWHVGDSWQYSDGYQLEVTELHGETATLDRADRSGDWIKRKGLFKIDSMSNGVRRQVVFRAPNPEKLFPLAIGNKVDFRREYLADKKLRVHQTTWYVKGRETIEVPAGEFDCWVLIWKTRSTTSKWEGFEKWWYSPVVGNFVRMEYRYGRPPGSSRVLLSYSKGRE